MTALTLALTTTPTVLACTYGTDTVLLLNCEIDFIVLKTYLNYSKVQSYISPSSRAVPDADGPDASAAIIASTRAAANSSASFVESIFFLAIVMS